MKTKKTEVIQKFIEAIEAELLILKNAAKDTASYATDPENKPENKYDTRGLEASYLAGAQAQRVAEMQDVLLCFRTQALKKFHTSAVVSIGALVQVITAEKIQYLLIMPLGGGQTIRFLDQTVQVVTPTSPLGKALIGQPVGEFITILAGGQKREYEIASIE
jgi:transcription elongation GreA/GreB family factor